MSTPRLRTLSTWTFLAAVALAVAGSRPAPSAVALADDDLLLASAERPSSYHLRVVRVSGVDSSIGAAIGCTRFCGTPVVFAADEPWGAPDQLQGLAREFGAARAEAVTGFIVQPDAAGEARFEVDAYPGETVVAVAFSAKNPREPGRAHELRLTIRRAGGGPALAEAHVLAYGERTVAIAAPSPIAGEWVVMAVTPLDTEAARERIDRLEQAGVSAGADPAGKVHRVEGEVTPPVLVERIPPQYPPAAKEAGRMGKVILEAVVDVEGRVRAIKVLKAPSGGEDLVAAATAAIEKWRYKPAQLHGKSVPVIFTIIVQFKLE